MDLVGEDRMTASLWWAFVCKAPAFNTLWRVLPIAAGAPTPKKTRAFNMAATGSFMPFIFYRGYHHGHTLVGRWLSCTYWGAETLVTHAPQMGVQERWDPGQQTGSSANGAPQPREASGPWPYLTTAWTPPVTKEAPPETQSSPWVGVFLRELPGTESPTFLLVSDSFSWIHPWESPCAVGERPCPPGALERVLPFRVCALGHHSAVLTSSGNTPTGTLNL